MDETLKTLLEQAIWVGRSLYERGKTSGSSANMSFRYQDHMYITVSGACFGTLTEDDFTPVSLCGAPRGDRKASKELPLHIPLYWRGEDTNAVIHTHSPYATLWSCLPHADGSAVIPPYTPYLQMKLGQVKLVPYAPPGSEALFAAFHAVQDEADGYLLQNHGPLVAGKDLMDAYCRLEELEDSARIAWELRREPDRQAMLIAPYDGLL